MPDMQSHFAPRRARASRSTRPKGRVAGASRPETPVSAMLATANEVAVNSIIPADCRQQAYSQAKQRVSLFAVESARALAMSPMAYTGPPAFRLRVTFCANPRPGARTIGGQGSPGRLRPDVLVETEQVRRVVGPLERAQPLVLSVPVRGPHSVLPLLAQEVHVDTAGGVRADHLPEIPGPRHAGRRPLGVGADRVDVHRVPGPPVLERRGFGIFPRDGPAEMEDDRVRLRGRRTPGLRGQRRA